VVAHSAGLGEGMREGMSEGMRDVLGGIIAVRHLSDLVLRAEARRRGRR
jgi:hypothetical protein